MTISIMRLMTLSISIGVIIPRAFMLSVPFSYCYAECLYAECRDPTHKAERLQSNRIDLQILQNKLSL